MGGPGLIDTMHPRYKEFVSRVDLIDYSYLTDEWLNEYHKILDEMGFPSGMEMALIIEDPTIMRMVVDAVYWWDLEQEKLGERVEDRMPLNHAHLPITYESLVKKLTS